LRRARVNGVPLEDVDEHEARRIEPNARTVGRALWSPSTSAVSPREVMSAMSAQLRREGVAVCPATCWIGTSTAANVQTDRGNVDAGYVVNAAGLHADRVAWAYGFGHGYRMLPFRGVYLYGNDSAPKLGVHVYPVPDLEMPFLGLHFTVTVDDRVKIGPTATPSAWREGYGLDAESLRRFSARDLAETARAGARMFVSDPSFRAHAGGELRKLDRRYLVRSAGELVHGIRSEDFREWGAPGIRAQLFDEVRGELVMDFRFQGDAQSIHVLNAVSPAFTCCLSFAEHLVDEIHALTG
jgi:L-2-hydroxyglutarate oxidase LhgO